MDATEGPSGCDAACSELGEEASDLKGKRACGRRHNGIRRQARRLALVVLGAAIYTFGIRNIHEVTGITEGGVIGLMLFLNHWLGMPASVVAPVLDIACYAIALKVLGGRFLGWAAVATGAVSVFFRIWELLPPLMPDLTGSPFLAAVAGGAFVGLGVGIIVRQGGSSCGDDALAMSINKLTGLRVGRCYLITDLTVLALSLSYIPLNSIVWSLLTVMISSGLIDICTQVSREHVRAFAEKLRERVFGTVSSRREEGARG